MLVARERHRSHHYFSEGDDHLTMSPGCADMAGLFIVPQADDFAKINPDLIGEMLSEVSIDGEAEKKVIWKLTRTQPELQVGIMSGKEIEFEIISDGAGRQRVSFENGRLSYNGTLYDELLFDARTMSTMFAEPTFILYGVTIGVDFHWERKLTGKFAGSLKFIVEGDNVVAVNVIGVEDYLLSVISSEMKPTAPLEYLKAHAVISRTWVMKQIARRKDGGNVVQCPEDRLEDGILHIERWFDTNDHKAFDVCADDHCQRYQGLTSAIGENARKAVDETWGEVLEYEGSLCDARFSKCCGGITEEFGTCWADENHPYLKSVPDPYCDTDDEEILRMVLNDYDLETRDFYRWQVRYTRAELSDLICRRSGHDIGMLKELKPLRRGPSGRIFELLIIGSRMSMSVGKELMIRRFLSESHLKSSAFTVSVEPGGTEAEDMIVLNGSGWGHGVGFCQIGAAVMAFRGNDYRTILSHYYPGAETCRIPELSVKTYE